MSILDIKLPYTTHLLEYNPGFFGDFVCGSITYSIDNYFDPNKNQERYWSQSDNHVPRNRYNMSLHGNGYEHIPLYNEIVLAHDVYMNYYELVDENDTNYYGDTLLFNTHPRLCEDMDVENCRTLTNSLDKMNTKILVIADDFDTVFFSACNVTLSSHIGGNIEELAVGRLLREFRNSVKYLKFAKEFVPENKTLDIGDIHEYNVDTISCYGSVNKDKFDEYYNSFVSTKLNMLDHIVKRVKLKLKQEPKVMEEFYKEYDKWMAN